MQNKYSDEERKRFCDMWKRSGKPKRHFCKDVGISISTFHGWLKKFNQKEVANSETTGVIKFLPIEEKAVVDQKIPVEIKLPNGLLIKIETNSLSKLINELLR